MEGIVTFGLGGVRREVAAVVPVARLSKINAWENWQKGGEGAFVGMHGEAEHVCGARPTPALAPIPSSSERTPCWARPALLRPAAPRWGRTRRPAIRDDSVTDDSQGAAAAAVGRRCVAGAVRAVGRGVVASRARLGGVA